MTTDNELIERMADAYDAARKFGNSASTEGMQAVLAVARKEIEAGKWWPIETAPKDGGSILISCDGGHTCIAYWDGRRWETTRMIVMPSDVTSWQPLPVIPEASDE